MEAAILAMTSPTFDLKSLQDLFRLNLFPQFKQYA